MLALVLCALVVMLADPVREYLEQRSQLAHQRSSNAGLQKQVDALQHQQQLWADPNYVREQARKRLYYVMPGETPYVVVGGGSGSSGTKARHTGAVAAAAPATGDWYGRLWASVVAAGGKPDTEPGR